MTLLPVAPTGLPTLAEVADAPLRACCRPHAQLVSDRYGAAVDWALLREETAGRPPAREMVEKVCQHLHGMNTAWTCSLYRLLACRPGSP